MINLSPFTILKSMIDPTSDVPKEVQVVEKFMQIMMPIHEAYQRQWFLNISNMIGNQWLVYDKVSNRFTVPPVPTWRVRLTINKILPIARQQIAKLGEVDPTFYVAARSADQSDIDGAVISTAITENIYHNTRFKENILEEIKQFIVTCGNYYVQPFYDEQAGREVVDRRFVPILDEAGNPFIDPNTNEPMVEEKEIRFKTGDLGFDGIDPFELVPDFGTTKWDEQSAVVKRKVRSTEYVKERYGVKVSSEVLNMKYTQSMKIMSQVSSMGGSRDMQTTMKNAVIVKDYYENPTKEFPKGRHIITADKKILHVGDLPVKQGGKYIIPIVPFGGISIPKRLLKMSPLENVLPLQWEYNRGRSQIIEDIRLMSRPKYTAAVDSVADDVITDQPGEVVLFEGPIAPAVLNGAQTIDRGRIDNLNRLDTEMADVGGVTIDVGRLPRRANSNLAINTLEERDTTIIGPMKESMRSGLERVFSIALAIAGDKFKEERILKILSDSQKLTFKKYRGTDLNSNDDVRMLSDKAFPQGRMAKFEFIMNLINSQIMSAQTGRKILKLDGFANMDQAMGDAETQRIAAEQAALSAPRGGAQGEPDLQEEAIAQKVAEELQANAG